MAFVSNSGVTATNTNTPGSPEHLVISHEDVAHSLILCELPDEDGYAGNMQSTVASNGRTLSASLRLNGLFDSNRRVWNCTFVVTEQQMKLFELLIHTQQSSRKPCSIVDFAVQAQNAQTYAIAPTTDALGIESGWGAYNVWIDTDQNYKSPFAGHRQWLLQFQAESIDANVAGNTNTTTPPASSLLYLTDRANHTGTQSSATISDFAAAVNTNIGNYLTAGTDINFDTSGGVLTINYDGAPAETDLSNTLAADSVTIVSSSGDDTTIPAATATEAGVMSAANFNALEANTSYLATIDESIRDIVAAFVQPGSGIAVTHDDAADTLTIDGSLTADLSMVPTANNVTIANTGGTDAVLAGATATNAGLLTSSSFNELAANTASLASIEETIRDTVAAFIVDGTNITVTHDDAGDTLTIDSSGGGAGAVVLTDVQNADNVVITPTGGTGTTITEATNTTAGVMSAAQVTALEALAASTGTVTLGTNISQPFDTEISGGVEVDKFGNVCVLRGSIQSTSTITSGSTVFTLPAGFRPSQNIKMTVQSSTGVTHTFLFKTDGVVSTNGGNINAFIRFNLSSIAFFAP